MAPPKVALFADCYHEVNGVALTCRQLVESARLRSRPVLAVHAGPETAYFAEGSVARLQLQRSRLRIPLDPDFDFDLLVWRHLKRVRRALEEFRPELIHITGPGDIGILGAILAWQLEVPLIASWHTNVHEFAARRVALIARHLPAGWREALVQATERFCLNQTVRYYRMARAILAPNRELVAMLGTRTRREALVMPRGVDTGLFSPAHRRRCGGPFVLGYVGRLTAEKNVRLLAKVDDALAATGRRYEIVIVGHGSEEAWLRRHIPNAVFTGVLKGRALAEAYANMDAFLFPSHTDTYGNVVQEALASGVPPILTASGGPKYLVTSGVDGLIAADDDAFVRLAVACVADGAVEGMRQEARRTAESRSWESVFDGVFAVHERFAAPCRQTEFRRVEEAECRA